MFASRKAKETLDYENIEWSLDLVETILIRDFPFLKDEKNAVQKMIECLTVYYVHNSQPHTLNSFGLLKDDVVKALMHIRLMEFELCWSYAFKAFGRKVASHMLQCDPEKVTDKYLQSRTSEKDTKKYMSKLLYKIDWELSKETLEYFEIEDLKLCPQKVNECVTKHFKECGNDPMKTLNGFFSAICFLNDYPAVCLKIYDDVNVLQECVDRLKTMFYGLSVSQYSSKFKNDVQRLSTFLEIFHFLLECKLEEDFRFHVLKAFEKMTQTVDQHLLIRYSRRIYMINYEKTRKDFFQIEKELKATSLKK